MQPKSTLILIRWIQWALTMIMFGLTFVFYLYDVYAYIYSPIGQKAQLGLIGFLHIYMYMSAIWASCIHGFGVFWMITDVVFALVSIAAAGLSQPTLSLFCVSEAPIWEWNGDLLAYVPDSVGGTTGNEIRLKMISKTFAQAECGSSAVVSALASILIILFALSIFFNVRSRRSGDRGQTYSQLPADLNAQNGGLSRGGIHQSLRRSLAPAVYPFNMNQLQPPVPELPQHAGGRGVYQQVS